MTFLDADAIEERDGSRRRDFMVVLSASIRLTRRLALRKVVWMSRGG